MRYFNDWLTKHNQPGSSNAAACSVSITALTGTTGKDGPLCLGYASAFKVLCDKPKYHASREMDELPVDFNGKPFHRFVDSATVYSDGRVVFTFRNGMEVRTEI